MTNFEQYKNTLTPEDVARAMQCGKCPLYRNKCHGFSHLTSFDECIKLLVDWFKEEAQQ